MATVYVTEFATTPSVAGLAQTAAFPATASQTVAITAGSVASSAFNVNTNLVRISTDAICSIAFGTAPTAAATSLRMPANTTEYFAVPRANAFKVAVITNT